MEDTILLIPTLNEEMNISTILQEAKKIKIKSIVIDGNSKDRTVEFAKRGGAEVIIQNGKGKGSAVIQAFKYIIKKYPKYKYIAMIDGDLTYPVHDIPSLVNSFSEGVVMVNGSRLNKMMEKGAMTKLNFIGNKFLNGFANLLHKTGTQDILSGLKIFDVYAVKKILPYMKAEGFSTETEMTILLSRIGKIKDCPIKYSKRGGETKLSPLRVGYRILDTIIKMKSD
ncbi:MAG: glycosyltransferase family 2 protein [Candidatus Nanoarchaeia archaeon]|nr:glycosyltransferase family 2 protein [Candidatus Nanoarchaeia archaeon]